MNGIILAISGRDNLRPLGIYFRHFANSVHEIEYHKQCSKFEMLKNPLVSEPSEHNLLITFKSHLYLGEWA